MKSNPMSKIKVNTGEQPRAKFNLAHDVNTTYDWGTVQPLMNKLLIPGSSMNVNMETLCRLAPMVAPTFGRVKMSNVAHYVSCEEIFPNWDYFLSKTPTTRPTSNGTTTFIPTTIPNITMDILTTFCLFGARATAYYVDHTADGKNKEYHQIYSHVTGSGSSTAKYTAMINLMNKIFKQATDNKNLGLANSPASVNGNLNYTGPRANFLKLVESGWFNTTSKGVIWGPINAYFDTAGIGADGSERNNYGYVGSLITDMNAFNQGVDKTVVGIEEADLIWETTWTNSPRTSCKLITNNTVAADTPAEINNSGIAIAFKLSNFGKRLRKILIASGYTPSLSDNQKVSLLPLFAYHKAYWETYMPERTKNYYSSAAWKLIQFCCESNVHCNITEELVKGTDLTDTELNDLVNILVDFITEVGNSFATEKMDIVSAATENPNIGSDANTFNLKALNELLNPDTNDTFEQAGENDTYVKTPYKGTNQPYVLLRNFASLSQQTLDALCKMYRYVNKGSVAGQNIAEILKANGLGKIIEESKTKFIGTSEMPIKISDVIATSDTTSVNEDGQTAGAALGQYGGRGLGYNSSQFSFSTDKFGYMIILSTIIPESGYVNQFDATNACLVKEDIYTPEFDGLSVEALMKKQVYGNVALCNLNDGTGNGTFGFVPTYTKWKTQGNIANGDFSRPATRNSMMPYTLDKYLPLNNIKINNDALKNINNSQASVQSRGSKIYPVIPSMSYNEMPTAGEDWRYISKYSWNGSYNRIFNAIGETEDYLDDHIMESNNSIALYNNYEPDNFMAHNIINAQYWAPMKPIEDSYNTFDEDHKPNGAISKQ